jgi:aspartate aminotransferase
VSLLSPTAVNSVLAEARALQAQGRELVSLMRGEPDFRTPPHIVEAGARALRDGRTGYADNRGEAGLREAIAGKLERENGLRYDPASEILVTDGATMSLYAALMAVLGEGDEVLLPSPIYDAYQSPVRLAGGSVRLVESRFEDGRFSLDPGALEAAWTPSARVLILNTPWNPVGTVMRPEEIRRIADFLERRDVLLISDEIYEWITYGANRHVSPPSLSKEIRERTLLVNSFSKTYAMTGWRLGYCAGPPALISAMLLVLQQSSRGPATFVQDAGAAALRGPQDCVAEMRAAYQSRRQLVLERLAGIRRVKPLPPEGGFFSMVDIRETGVPSNEARRRLLAESGVVVIHGAAYGAAGEGTLRVSFARGGETLSAGLDRLRGGLASL